MGANNSVPQTAEFVNSNVRPTMIQITPEVAQRLNMIADGSAGESDIKSTKYVCENCIKEKEKQLEGNKTVQQLNPQQQKLLEIEKFNFEKKLKELEDALPKPAKEWDEESKAQLKSLESDLLQCYKQYRGEPLNCHKNAKDFQHFIYHRRYKTFQKNAQAGGDNPDPVK